MPSYFIFLELWHNLLKEPGERLHDLFWEMPGSDTSHIHIPWTSIFYLNRFPISAGFFHSLNLYFSETWLPPGPVCFPLGKVALIVVTCFSPPPLGGDCTVEVIFVMTNSKYNTGAHFFFNRCPTLETYFCKLSHKMAQLSSKGYEGNYTKCPYIETLNRPKSIFDKIHRSVYKIKKRITRIRFISTQISF